MGNSFQLPKRKNEQIYKKLFIATCLEQMVLAVKSFYAVNLVTFTELSFLICSHMSLIWSKNV